MLDSIFGGFSKSKKKHGNNSNNNNDDSPNEDNSYVFVGGNDPNRPAYPQTIYLNDELIRGGGAAGGSSQPNQMYPSLDPNAPWSSQPKSSDTTCHRNVSPIDNVPFSVTYNGGGPGGPSHDESEDYEIQNVLKRIESFFNSNASKYEFTLENSILREALARE